MKEYFILNKKMKISLNENLVKLFEDCQGPLTNVYIEHLMQCKGFNETFSPEVISKEISSSLIEELEVLCTIPEDFKKYLIMGF